MSHYRRRGAAIFFAALAGGTFFALLASHVARVLST